MTATIDNTTTPLPDVNERDQAGFWQGTLAGELRVQACDGCGALRWPPRPVCPHCYSQKSSWKKVASEGELFTWTVVGTSVQEGFSKLVPYAVGAVQLDGVPIRMLGYIDADPASLKPGERMVVRFVRKSDTVSLPIWTRPQAAQQR